MAKKAARPNNEIPATIPDHDAGCDKPGIAESLNQGTSNSPIAPAAAFLKGFGKFHGCPKERSVRLK